MKKRKSLSIRQLLLVCIFLLTFAGLTLLLFIHHKDEKKFSHISSQLFVQEMKDNTLSMHYTLANPAAFGIYDYKPSLPSYNPKSQLTGQASTENILSALANLDKKNLSEKDAYTCLLLERSLENSLQLNSYLYYQDPLSPSSGMQSQLPILLAEYTFRNDKDITDYLALLDQTDEYFASLLSYEQAKAAAGLSMPASTLEKVKKQCDTIVTLDSLEAETHFLQTTFQERLQVLLEAGELSPADAAAYTAQNNRLLKTVLLPAYEALADGLFLLEDTSIPLSGLGQKPHGKEFYQLLLISQTGSYRTIADIKKLLKHQFQQECQTIHTLLSHHPELANTSSDLYATVFPYRNTSTMLTDLQGRMAEDFPPFPTINAIDTLPELTVKRVSPSLEAYCAPAFYLTAPIDDTDNNVIYINQKNSPDSLELYTTLAHEGYPGHMYQTVYCNRNFLAKQENKVRQLLWYGGYLEGWAIYVEFRSYDYAAALVQEQGFASAALSIELEKHNRSLQLCLYSLLDIMIHYDNASCQQVTELLKDLGISNPSSAQAVYTYIAEEPCNYPKYYLGYLEILELQKSAKEAWKENYSDYTFHTFYLDCGPSDFTSLAERVSSFVPTVRKN